MGSVEPESMQLGTTTRMDAARLTSTPGPWRHEGQYVFSITEQPTGAQLQAFRHRCRYRGGVPTQQDFADSIGLPVSTYRGYEIETKGTLMPAQAWTLLRTTWDALLRAQWQQQHCPAHE